MTKTERPWTAVRLEVCEQLLDMAPMLPAGTKMAFLALLPDGKALFVSQPELDEVIDALLTLRDQGVT